MRATSWWDRFFLAAIIVKGLDGVLEVISALVLALTSPGRVQEWIFRITAPELSEDPTDFVATHLAAWAHGFSANAQTFVILYLLTHGVVKLVLVVALLRDKLWQPSSLALAHPDHEASGTSGKVLTDATISCRRIPLPEAHRPRSPGRRKWRSGSRSE